MAVTDVYIGADEELFGKLQELLTAPDVERVLKGTYPANILASTAIPDFPTQEQVDYLKDIGVDMKFGNYRVYITSRVESPVEHPGGMELPANVLDSEEVFRKEVLDRIREKLGSPNDN